MTPFSGHDLDLLDPIFQFSSFGEDDGGHHQRIAGDFYREPDDVVRGLNMEQVGLAQHDGCISSLAHGDFYGDEDGAFFREQGYIMGTERVPQSSFFGEEALDFRGSFLQMSRESPMLFYHGLHTNKIEHAGIRGVDALGCTIKFAETDQAPDQPRHSFFKFEDTTLFIPGAPGYIGNCILDFLNTCVVSSVNKVRREKFSIKAEVFIENIMCTIKIRLYNRNDGTHACEFQRRSGDCVTFNLFYKKAAAFLKRHFPAVLNTPEVIDECPPPLMLMGAAEESCEKAELPQLSEQLSPLLDLAGLVKEPGLQAESARALADLAQDIQSAVTLCNGRPFEEFKRLLQTGQSDAAYPAARALLLLAQFPQSVPFFADTELLSSMLNRVRPNMATALVQKEVATVLRKVLPRCAVQLTENESRDISLSLSEVMQDNSGNAMIYQILHEAQVGLEGP